MDSRGSSADTWSGSCYESIVVSGVVRSVVSPVAWPVRLVRALVVALLLPLASNGALPVWAELVGVEAPHVCRCSVDHHDCVCAKCHPDRDEPRLSRDSVRGRCGDDDVPFAGKAMRAVATSTSLVLRPPVAVLSTPTDVPAPASAPPPPPPTPPPQA